MSPGPRRAVIRFLVGMLVTVTSVPFAKAQNSTPEQQQSQARENEIRRRMEDEERKRTERLLKAFRDDVELTRKLTEELFAQAEAFSKRLSGLLQNDDGKRLAQDPVAFTAFLKIDETPPVVLSDVRTHLDAITAIRKMLDDETTRVNVGFLPSEATQREADGHRYWATERMANLKERSAWLETTLKSLAGNPVSSNAKTLQQVIDEYRAQAMQLVAKARLEGEAKAKDQTEKILVEAETLRLLGAAQAKSDQLLAESRKDIERMRLEFDERMLKMQAEEDARRAAAEIRYQDLQSELERTRKAAEAERTVKDSRAEIERKDKLADAEKQQKIQKAQSAEVRALLAPFLAEGYAQPGRAAGGFDKGPVSFKAIQAYGALDPSTTGLKQLHNLGNNKTLDKERPRWGHSFPFSSIQPSQRDQVRKAQDLLRELGPTLVELGMLAP